MDPTSFMLTLMLVFGRIAGLLTMMPGTSTRGIPKHATVLASMAVSLVVVPTVEPVASPTTTMVTVFGIISEIAIGALLGGVVATVFASIGMASEILSMQTGMSMATVFNPVLPTQNGPSGVIASLLAGAVFVGAGYHGECLVVLAHSFTAIPPGLATVPLDGAPVVLGAASTLFELGIQLSGPVLILVWLINLFVAIFARIAPRMNVFFAIGMNASSLGGIWLFALAIPWVLKVHQGAVETAISWSAKALGL